MMDKLSDSDIRCDSQERIYVTDDPGFNSESDSVL